MFEVALFGAGKIGEAICALLIPSTRYKIRVCDSNEEAAKKLASQWNGKASAHHLDLKNEEKTLEQLKGCAAVISALPFYCNVQVATYAKKLSIHYLDLTEDVKTTNEVSMLSQDASSAFLPQCGLAPGFISIAAHHVISQFDDIESVKMRVGALPLFPSNRLKYNLTWSTEGLINEYGNVGQAIEDFRIITTQPLEGYETFSLNGDEYEAFNTSGGLGTLCETLKGKVKSLNYKSIRYIGHHSLVSFLMNDLKFNENRKELKDIFERSIPHTTQDKCIVFVEAIGTKDGKFSQKTYANTIYNSVIEGHAFGAIQTTTASGNMYALRSTAYESVEFFEGDDHFGIHFPFLILKIRVREIFLELGSQNRQSLKDPIAVSFNTAIAFSSM